MLHLLRNLLPPAAMIITATACGSAVSPPRGAHPPSATTPPTATGAPRTPGPPDVREVHVVNAGIGAYEHTILPVAIIRNLSTALAATKLTVTFTVLSPSGATVTQVTQTIAILGAGQTTVVGARVAGSDVGGGARATVDVGSWTAAVPAVITSTPGFFGCGRCGPASGYGEVTTVLTSNVPNPPAPLDVAVACTAADGAIDGGGSKTFAWTAGSGLSRPASVPVLVNGAPTACLVGATPAS